MDAFVEDPITTPDGRFSVPKDVPRKAEAGCKVILIGKDNGVRNAWVTGAKPTRVGENKTPRRIGKDRRLLAWNEGAGCARKATAVQLLRFSRFPKIRHLITQPQIQRQ